MLDLYLFVTIFIIVVGVVFVLVFRPNEVNDLNMDLKAGRNAFKLILRKKRLLEWVISFMFYAPEIYQKKVRKFKFPTALFL